MVNDIEMRVPLDNKDGEYYATLAEGTMKFGIALPATEKAKAKIFNVMINNEDVVTAEWSDTKGNLKTKELKLKDFRIAFVTMLQQLRDKAEGKK